MSTVDEKTLEQRLCELFADILGVAEVRAQDSFFDLGGHSLLASKLARQITGTFGVKISMKRIYAAPTATALAKELAAAAAKGA